MPSRLKNALSVGLAATATASLVLLPATPASAKVYYGKRTLTKFGCVANLDVDHRGKGKWYARGRFHTKSDWNTFCRVKLQRKKGNGSWKNASNVGAIQGNGSASTYRTGWHWNGEPYKSRVCLQYLTQDKWYCSGGW